MPQTPREPNIALSRGASHVSHMPQKPRRMSANSLEGQRGVLQTHKGTIGGRIGLRDRIHHFTWAWFLCTMSTGGISLVLAETPHRFNGLTVLGDIVFLLNVTLFVLFCSLLAARFIMFPKTFMASFQHPTESLFFPSFWISIANILSGVQSYGGPKSGYWLVITMRVLFWTYAALTFCVAVGQYFFLFTGKPLTIQDMTPQWIIPVFPIMLLGTLASLISPSQPHESALPMLMAGITFQGLGMLIAAFMYGPYISRLMTSGLPSPNTRPGMFIAVGPPSFTGLALLGISEDLARIYPRFGKISSINNPEIIPDAFRIIAVSAALFLWATAFWFFSLSLLSVIHGALDRRNGKGRGLSFHLVWWAFVFPNVGFCVCTINIGKAFMSEGILWVGSAMTIALVAMWLFCGVMHIRAVWKKKILWPGLDEDHDQ